MQRRLIVMRHAKSAWNTGARSDHSRPLNGRGRRDAPRMAAELARLGWVPDAAWSSDSERTRETWKRMAEAWDEDVPVTFDESLYLAGLGDIQGAALAWPESAGTVLVLGHNPGWEEAASRLGGVDLVMTTANAALLEGSGTTWSDALERPWTLHALLRPKDLGQ